MSVATPHLLKSTRKWDEATPQQVKSARKWNEATPEID